LRPKGTGFKFGALKNKKVPRPSRAHPLQGKIKIAARRLSGPVQYGPNRARAGQNVEARTGGQRPQQAGGKKKPEKAGAKERKKSPEFVWSNNGSIQKKRPDDLNMGGGRAKRPTVSRQPTGSAQQDAKSPSRAKHHQKKATVKNLTKERGDFPLPET